MHARTHPKRLDYCYPCQILESQVQESSLHRHRGGHHGHHDRAPHQSGHRGHRLHQSGHRGHRLHHRALHGHGGHDGHDPLASS